MYYFPFSLVRLDWFVSYSPVAPIRLCVIVFVVGDLSGYAVRECITDQLYFLVCLLKVEVPAAEALRKMIYHVECTPALLGISSKSNTYVLLLLEIPRRAGVHSTW